MSKKSEETMPPFTPGVPVPQDHGVPAEFANEMAEYAGAGLSDRAEDFLLPFLYIAQTGSPQVKKQRTDKFIPGLEVGDIFNTATGQFWKGEAGVAVIPAFFKKAMVEWLPREEGGGDGSGYVATHEFDTPLRERLIPGPKGGFIIKPGSGPSSGHQLIETAYHFVIIAETLEPAVISMSSTGLQISRQWLTLLRNNKIPTPNGLVTAPSFARVYQLKTAWRQNDQGDWFLYKPEDLGWAGAGYEDARRIAKEFFVEARESGVRLGRPPVDISTDEKTVDGAGEEVPI